MPRAERHLDDFDNAYKAIEKRASGQVREAG
jgi:hypothetical protein